MTQTRFNRANTFLLGAALLAQIAATPALFAADEPPARCAGYGELQSFALTDWAGGLGAWTAGTHDVANPATFDTSDWAAVGNLPAGRPGTAAFVANLNSGNCEDDDESGALSLDSPSIGIPAGSEVPRIAVVHWFQTESGWDGGNLKISVNGGPFELIPSSAIEFNGYTDTLLPAQTEFGLIFNTNPLAGQAAFTGTDGGAATGSWIESRVNLLGLAAAGDTIRLRFDFGVDGCDGEVGWYVDEVEVYSCAAELPPSDCGNRVLDAGEQCDDGNDFVGDGCSNTCQIEPGWQCTDPIAGGTVADPGFEAGTPNPSWTESSNNLLGTPICETATCGTGSGSGPSQGAFWAWFGGIPDTTEEGSLAQSVVIPAELTELTFDLEVSACDSAADYLEVLIDGNREWLVNGSSPLCGDSGYRTQSVDISAYADGGSHHLEFHSETFANNNGPSNFFVDEVDLPAVPSYCIQEATTRLTLVKKVINNDGGSAPASAWTLTAAGPTGFSGAGPSVSSGSGFAAGVYGLSESGGPAGYAASSWSCVGGDQVDGTTISIAAGDNVTCTITNDDIAATYEINAGQSGAWYFPDTSGQGIFIDIQPTEKFMFISWFTYTHADSADPFEQRWFTAQGNYLGNEAPLVLSETLGGRFDDPQEVTTLPVGVVSLSFTDCDQGYLTYTIDGEGLQGGFPLVRVIPGSGDVCSDIGTSSTQAVDINAGMDGAWYDPNTSGQGFFIDAHPDPEGGDFIFVSWFTYGEDTASGQRWLTAQGAFEGSVAEIVISETTGGSFDDPLDPSTVPVGTMTLDFSDCKNALLSYSLPEDGLEGDISLTRVVPNGEALCEELMTPQ
jgi:cysteine-rich repeat protein